MLEKRVPHIPVMLPEVLAALAPREGGVYVDGTFGAGGYSRALLDSCPCRVLAFDRDSAVRPHAIALEKGFPGRFFFEEKCFSELQERLLEEVDGMVFDLGVSSMQLAEAGRGFSFQLEGPLDMRMGRNRLTASQVINTFSEEDLASIFWLYGEEKRSRTIARRIVMCRTQRAIDTTQSLREIVASVLGNHGRIDPATRVFQALRIYVNDELHELQKALACAEACIKPQGRLVVVSFHSLEDRLVKQFLKGPKPEVDPLYGGKSESSLGPFTPLYEKPLSASSVETDCNPRARSAKLRVGVKRMRP